MHVEKPRTTNYSIAEVLRGFSSRIVESWPSDRWIESLAQGVRFLIVYRRTYLSSR
jgi:hypothetical protein